MAKRALGYWDYVKAAFWRRVPVRRMGAMPLNQMALGVVAVAGIANPGFWLLGAAGELLYLTIVSSSSRFQKLVRGEQLQEAQESWEGRLRQTMAGLDPPSRYRYQALLNQCRRIVGLQDAKDDENLGDLRELQSSGLNQLLTIFLRLLTSRELTLENLRNVQPGALEAEIARIEQRLAKADPEADVALRRSLQGTLDIQRKRLENLSRGHSSLEIIDAELDRIEQQVELIREESAIRGRPEVLSSRLDAVSSAMSETTRWMDEHEEVLGSFSDELDMPPTELPKLRQ